MVLPHAPEGVIDALVLQNLLATVTAGNRAQKFVTNQINAELSETNTEQQSDNFT